MNIGVGDRVSVLDEDINGIVTKIADKTITIETTDGFDLEFFSHEVVVTKSSFKKDVFSGANLKSVIAEKEAPRRKNQPKVKAKERTLPAMEVDLHIHQLTKSNRSMSNHDMLTLQLDTAERQLKFAINKRIQKMVFIHGVGEGVLKLELEYLLGRYNNVKFYAADYQKYGLGATEVYIYQNTNP